MDDIDILDMRLNAAQTAIRALPVGDPPLISTVARRRSRRRVSLVSAVGVVVLFAGFIGFNSRRATVDSAADPQGVGTKIGDTPWRLMLLPDGWTAALVDAESTMITSAEGQEIELSATSGARPPTDETVVIGPLVDGYSTGSTVYVERIGWTLEVGIAGEGSIDPNTAAWLLQSIGRVDIVAPFADVPLPEVIPDVVGLDYEVATERLLTAGIRASWRAVPKAQTPGTVVEVERATNHVVLIVAAVSYEFDEVTRYEAAFRPEGDGFMQARWQRASTPFVSRPPFVFLRGEIIGTAESWTPSSSGGYVPVQEFSRLSREPIVDPGPEVAMTEVPTPSSESAPRPLDDPAVTYQGLALATVPDGWTVIQPRVGFGCPTERTIVLGQRGQSPVDQSCTWAYGATLPKDFVSIEPLPTQSGGVSRACENRWSQEEGGPLVQSCSGALIFPTGFDGKGGVDYGDGVYLLFDGIDALVTAGGEGRWIVDSLVYADGHSAPVDDLRGIHTVFAEADLNELREGGGGCAALADHAAVDFDLAACDALGVVAGTVAERDVMGTFLNPQPDARGTIIRVVDGAEAVPYMLAHRWVWSSETLAGEWRIASIARYTGPWPPPEQLPGRPPSQSLPASPATTAIG